MKAQSSLLSLFSGCSLAQLKYVPRVWDFQFDHFTKLKIYSKSRSETRRSIFLLQKNVKYFGQHCSFFTNRYFIVFSKSDLTRGGSRNLFLKKPNDLECDLVLVVTWVKLNSNNALLSPPPSSRRVSG